MRRWGRVWKGPLFVGRRVAPLRALRALRLGAAAIYMMERPAVNHQVGMFARAGAGALVIRAAVREKVLDHQERRRCFR